MAPSAPWRVTGPSSIFSPQPCKWARMFSVGTATTKQRSWVPGMVCSAASQSCWEASKGRRFSFCPPNFSATREGWPKSSRSMPSTRWYQEAMVSTSRQLMTRWSSRSTEKRMVGSAFLREARGDLDLDQHVSRLQPGDEQGRGRLCLAEVALDHRPAGWPVGAVRHDEQHPHHVVEAGAGLGQRLGDVLEGLLGLGDDAVA